MFRVFISPETKEFTAVEVGYPENNFAFEDWREFTARLKRVLEYEYSETKAVHSQNSETVKERRKSAN